MSGVETALALFGHGQAEAEFAHAMRAGRLHHGWLIEGPRGIGKARLALRLAVRLLGGDPEQAGNGVAQRVSAGNHPDFRQLSRVPDEKGKLPQDIPAAEVRDFLSFFTLKPALGGRRVGLIDSLDELNRFGANAILKTLEEPPPGGVLILLTHGSRPVLPTIRSRCRRLRLSALDVGDSQRVLQAAREPDAPGNLEALNALAPGCPGQALRLAGEAGMAAAAAVAAIAQAWPRPGDARFAQFVLAAGESPEAFEAAGLALLNWLAQNARGSESRSRLNWSKAWLETSRDLATARELAMDPSQVAAKVCERLQALARM